MHGVGRVLEVADALVDGEWRVLVPASSSGGSGDQQGAKRGDRWSKCARLTDSVPDDCSESFDRCTLDSHAWESGRPVARAPPMGHDGAPSKSSRTFCSAQRLYSTPIPTTIPTFRTRAAGSEAQGACRRR